MIGCAVPLISLVLSDVDVGAVNFGQLPLGLEVHEVQVDAIGEGGGQTSLGLHLPDSFHEGQAVFHQGLTFQYFVFWAQVVLLYDASSVTAISRKVIFEND